MACLPVTGSIIEITTMPTHGRSTNSVLLAVGVMLIFVFSIASAYHLINQDEEPDAIRDDSSPQTSSFVDVPLTHRNYQAIETLRQYELIRGYGDGTFRPSQLVTRSEATAMIVRGLDPENPHPDPGRYKNCFGDVSTQWFARYVCFGKSNLWVKGYPGTQDFRPGSQVIIVEFLRMAIDGFKIGVQAPITLYKHMWDIPLGFKNEPERFPTQQWWETYMVTARFWNFLDITPPAGKLVSRGEVAEIIYRIMQHKKLIPTE